MRRLLALAACALVSADGLCAGQGKIAAYGRFRSDALAFELLTPMGWRTEDLDGGGVGLKFPGDDVTGITVFRQDGEGVGALKDKAVIRLLKAQYPGFALQSAKGVSIDGLKGRQYAFSARSGRARLRYICAMLYGKGAMYTITFVATKKTFKSQREVFQTVARSFSRVKGQAGRSLTYTDKALGFTLSLPRGWTSQQAEGRSLFVARDVAESGATVTITAHRARLTDLLQPVKDGILRLEQGKIEGANAVTFGKRRGAVIIFSAIDKGVPIVGIMNLVEGAGKVFLVDCEADRRHFARYNKAFNAMVESLDETAPAARPADADLATKM